MSAAPWWGWLILLCVLIVDVAWVATALISARSIRRLSGSIHQSYLRSRR